MVAQEKKRQRLVSMWVLVAGLLALAQYLFYGAQATGNFGFPLDDSWIHMQIARNLATGFGWSFNPGESTGASTTPLWVLVLALLHVGWPDDPSTAVKVLGSLLYLADLALITLLAWRVTEDWRVALVAGTLAAWQPAFVWAALSGMETPFYLLLILLGLHSLLRAEQPAARSAYGATLWFTLAGWARPEAWILLPVAWSYLVWRRQELQGGRLWLHVLIAAAGLGAFAVFNGAAWGHPLPATWYAKAAFVRGDQALDLVGWLLNFGFQVMSSIQATVHTQNPVLVVMVAVGCLAAWRAGGAHWRRVVLLLAVAFASVVAASLADLGSVSYQNHRRAAHLVAGMNVLTALGAVAVWDALVEGIRLPFFGRPVSSAEVAGHTTTLAHRRWSGLAVALGLAFLALAMQVTGLRQGARSYANDVRSIDEGDVAAARWLAAHTSPDALVAVNDIGAMAYFGQRRIVDLVGLASPEVIDVLAATAAHSLDREQRLKALLVELGVDYVVIFPEWFPYLAQDAALTEEETFVVLEATALAHERVVIYRLHAEANLP